MELEKKMEDFKNEIRSAVDEVKAEKRDLEKRLAEAKNASAKEESLLATTMRSVYDGLMEKRAITLSGAGAVEVVNALFKVFRDKTEILDGLRYFSGPNASTKIPVLSPRPARAGRVAEGVTNASADSTAALGHTDLEPETYYSELPVSWETLKYLPVDFEAQLGEIFGTAFATAAANQVINGRGKTTYYEFGGLFTSVPAGNQIACGSSGAPTIADLVKLALKMQEKVMNDPCIVISPTLYAGISTASVSGYDVYKNELILNRTIEGVKVLVCGQAPSTTTANAIVAVGFDRSDYAIGLTTDIEITPIRKPGDTNTYFQAVMGMDGKPIVAANTYALKAISG
jgi:HK97 family phage major capsid protein